MRHRLLITLAVMAVAPLLVWPAAAPGQQDSNDEARPAPRWPDGRINLGPPAGETGAWQRRTQLLVQNPNSYQANVSMSAPIHIDDVPLQPWAKALTNYRHTLNIATEPYARCKVSGGPRQIMSPYGLEIIDMPEIERVYIMNVANAMSYRVVYMDGRDHPEYIRPSYLGHSIGHWDGDTLVVESVGYNERFWMARDGLPHTEQLRMTERFTRVDFDTLQYEVTIDDPGVYTAPWTSGFVLGWTPDVELFEYICQENNLSIEVMYGDGLDSKIVP